LRSGKYSRYGVSACHPREHVSVVAIGQPACFLAPDVFLRSRQATTHQSTVLLSGVAVILSRKRPENQPERLTIRFWRSTGAGRAPPRTGFVQPTHSVGAAADSYSSQGANCNRESCETVEAVADSDFHCQVGCLRLVVGGYVCVAIRGGRNIGEPQLLAGAEWSAPQCRCPWARCRRHQSPTGCDPQIIRPACTSMRFRFPTVL
jgi:hypothetical protein